MDRDCHTILVMPKKNVHQHAFVIEAADIIFETIEEAVEYLQTIGKSIHSNQGESE